MKREKLRIIDLIPFNSFKEKIALTKLYKEHKVRVYGNFVYVQKWRMV